MKFIMPYRKSILYHLLILDQENDQDDSDEFD